MKAVHTVKKMKSYRCLFSPILYYREIVLVVKIDVKFSVEISVLSLHPKKWFKKCLSVYLMSLCRLKSIAKANKGFVYIFTQPML